MRTQRKPSAGEILRLFRTAGFATLTPLQKKLVPLILSGRDIAVTADHGSGATAGYLLPLMEMFRSEPGGGLPLVGEAGVQGPRAVILVSDSADVKEVARESARFSRVVRGAPAVTTIGESDDARKEERLLERAPAVLLGTAGRVIDHIRRGGLPLEKVRTVVVEMPSPDQAEEFIKDVQFIFAKLPAHRQTILITRTAGQDAALSDFLRRPALLSSGKPLTHEHIFFQAVRGEKPDLLVRVFLARGLEETIVVTSPRTDGAALVRALSACRIEAAFVGAGAAPAVRKKVFPSFSRGEIDALVVAYPPPADLDVSHARFILYYDLPPVRSAAAAGKESQPFVRFSGGLIALTEGPQERELEKIQEAHGVEMKMENRPENADVIRGSLERIMRMVREEENLDELAAMRTLVKKHVPILMRSYVLAYLVKSSLPAMTAQQTRPAPAGEKRPKPPELRGRQRPEETPKPAGRPQDRPQGEGRGKYTQLFVSIGRNRRVYPRDLSTFFQEKLSLHPEEIGAVRVFDKYSFVEISTGRAEDAIRRLSGSDFKGKNITVNFAKKKEEKGGS